MKFRQYNEKPFLYQPVVLRKMAVTAKNRKMKLLHHQLKRQLKVMAHLLPSSVEVAESPGIEFYGKRPFVDAYSLPEIRPQIERSLLSKEATCVMFIANVFIIYY